MLAYMAAHDDTIMIVRTQDLARQLGHRNPKLKGRFLSEADARAMLVGQRKRVILEDADWFIRRHLGVSPDIITIADTA